MTGRQLIWVRRTSQAFFLILFVFLLIESRLPQEIYYEYSLIFSHDHDLTLDYPVTFFFQLDPLVGLSTLLSAGKLMEGVLWALAVVIITVLLGRIFCGFICPFGTIHHIVSSVRPSLKGNALIEANRKTPSQKTKYFLLLLLLIAAFIGLNLSGLLDPICFLFRSVALAVLPGIGAGLKSLFHAMAESDIKALNLMSYGGEILISPVFGYEHQSFQTGWFIGLLFLFVIFLNRIRPRFWCRVLCPLGGLLGLCSRMSVLRLEKDQEKCTQCKLCVKGCQGAASPLPGETWENAECVTCFNCFAACPEDALSFRLRWSPRMNQRPDLGRRVILGGLLAGISLPFLGRLGGQVDKTSDPRLVRPPGSLPEKQFLEACQRCGLCMKVCPTNVINPTLGEAGMAGVWTPRLIMTMGYCEYTCTLCSSVCPTEAIKKITGKEKIERPIKIGSAFVDRGRCLPWSGNAPCIVCEEVCPTSPKAIYLRKETIKGPGGRPMKVQLPFVDLKKCVGCGICENKCPVRGMPAIRVIAAGESRSLKNQILL
jgi:MauM/NapG family ferredoxin protein